MTFAMLMGYKAGWLQATPGLRSGLMIAMGGIMRFYVIGWIASMFGIHPPGFINGAAVGIAFSLFVVGIASMSLMLDFDLIDQVPGRVWKGIWNGTRFRPDGDLGWLYMEILRLLSVKIQQNR